MVSTSQPISVKIARNITNLLTSVKAKRNTFFLPPSIFSVSNYSHPFDKPIHILLQTLKADRFIRRTPSDAVPVEDLAGEDAAAVLNLPYRRIQQHTLTPGYIAQYLQVGHLRGEAGTVGTFDVVAVVEGHQIPVHSLPVNGEGGNAVGVGGVNGIVGDEVHARPLGGFGYGVAVLMIGQDVNVLCLEVLDSLFLNGGLIPTARPAYQDLNVGIDTLGTDSEGVDTLIYFRIDEGCDEADFVGFGVEAGEDPRQIGDLMSENGV